MDRLTARAGNAVSVKYKGNEYYYRRNAQNDVIKPIDANVANAVEYI